YLGARAGRTREPDPKIRPLAPLFGLAPGGVCRAAECCHRRGALLPHPFTLTGTAFGAALRRFAFCCTFRGLTPPRRYLAPCPWSPDFPPRVTRSDCLADSDRMVGPNGRRDKRRQQNSV